MMYNKFKKLIDYIYRKENDGFPYFSITYQKNKQDELEAFEKETKENKANNSFENTKVLARDLYLAKEKISPDKDRVVFVVWWDNERQDNISEAYVPKYNEKFKMVRLNKKSEKEYISEFLDFSILDNPKYTSIDENEQIENLPHKFLSNNIPTSINDFDFYHEWDTFNSFSINGESDKHLIMLKTVSLLHRINDAKKSSSYETVTLDEVMFLQNLSDQLYDNHAKRIDTNIYMLKENQDIIDNIHEIDYKVLLDNANEIE